MYNIYTVRIQPNTVKTFKYPYIIQVLRLGYFKPQAFPITPSLITFLKRKSFYFYIGDIMTYEALLAEKAAWRKQKLKNRKECETFTGIDRIKCLLKKDIDQAKDLQDVYQTCGCFCIAVQDTAKVKIGEMLKEILPNDLKQELTKDGTTLAGCKIIEVDKESGNVVNYQSIEFGEDENAQDDK